MPKPKPAPKIVTQDVVMRPRPVSVTPKTFQACTACEGKGKRVAPCPDKRCGEVLYVHDCTIVAGKKIDCTACAGSGKVPCGACNGHGDVEFTPPESTTPEAIACPKCRPEDHDEQMAKHERTITPSEPIAASQPTEEAS